jgi:hypothetical protein
MSPRPISLLGNEGEEEEKESRCNEMAKRGKV